MEPTFDGSLGMKDRVEISVSPSKKSLHQLGAHFGQR
jgi:hypothetical protein